MCTLCVDQYVRTSVCYTLPCARLYPTALGNRPAITPAYSRSLVASQPRSLACGFAASQPRVRPRNLAASQPHSDLEATLVTSKPRGLAASQPRGLAASNPLTAGGLAASFRQCRETLGDMKSQREGSGGPGGATPQRRNAQQHCAEQIMIMKIARITHGRSFDLSKNLRADLVVITALRPYSLRCAAVLRRRGFAAASLPRGFVCGCVSIATHTVLNARPYGTTV